MKKLATILLAFAMLSILLEPIGANGIIIYVNFDKVEYEPGGQGTISIIIRNTSEDPIEVKNVSIEFTNWRMYTVDGWDELGNWTILYSEPITVNSNKTVALEDISFTVPTDGRAKDTPARIWIYTNKPGPEYIVKQVDVIDHYQQSYLRALDNIVMLLTVVAILAIISAIIIAAAIFLSGRRPGVTWQKEQ